MPCKNGYSWDCQIQNVAETLCDEHGQCQGCDNAIDQQPKTGGGKIRFWASARDRFDENCQWLANHECGHRRDDKAEGGVIKSSTREYSDKQGAEDEDP